jgi:cytochrome c biogenesis protein CcmG, thiol:disulfide interchange protein DsbE
VTQTDSPRTKAAWRLIYLLPLGLFMALALVFLSRLQSGEDPEAIPSALIGKPAPEFSLPPLDKLGVPGLARGDLLGKITLVNVFASWCVPCRQEHPVLTELAKDTRIRVVGIDYKDQPGNALAFLNEMGNPYAAVGVDQRGRTFIDWGAYGVPETFLVGPDGIIVTKVIGALDAENVERLLRPAIAKLNPAGG